MPWFVLFLKKHDFSIGRARQRRLTELDCAFALYFPIQCRVGLLERNVFNYDENIKKTNQFRMDAWSRIVRRCHEATKKPNKTKWKSGTDFVFAFRYRHRARVTRTQHFIAFIPRILRVEPSFFVHSVYVLFTTFTNLPSLCDFPPKVILDS